MEMVHAFEERMRAREVPDLDDYWAQPFAYAETVAYIKKSAEHLRAVCKAAKLPLEERQAK